MGEKDKPEATTERRSLVKQWKEGKLAAAGDRKQKLMTQASYPYCFIPLQLLLPLNTATPLIHPFYQHYPFPLTPDPRSSFLLHHHTDHHHQTTPSLSLSFLSPLSSSAAQSSVDWCAAGGALLLVSSILPCCCCYYVLLLYVLHNVAMLLRCVWNLEQYVCKYR